jgi:hypothetical protein
MSKKKKPDAADILETALADPSASPELTRDLRAVYTKHFGPLPADAVQALEEYSGGGGHEKPPE